MAFPVVLVDSGSGSDSAASGAGPGTAVTGSKGRTRNSAGELRVGFFEASAPDLSGVSTTGSDVLYISISTAGQRNFSSIAGKKNTDTTDTLIAATNGSADFLDIATGNYTVGDIVQATDGVTTLYTTVASITAATKVTMNDTWSGSTGNVTLWNPRQVTLTASQGLNTGASDTAWAIGGKRATIAGTNSIKLFSNNIAAGDAMPGWIVELQSGHAESISAAIDLRRAGDTTTGPIIFRGKAGAATLPKITTSSAINMIVPRGGYQIIRDMELNTTGGSPVGIIPTASPTLIDGIKLSRTSTNTFTTGITMGDPTNIVNCEIAFCANGILNSGAGSFLIQNNYIHNCTTAGINETADNLSTNIIGNIITSCADGIILAAWGAFNRGTVVSQNTIDSCTNNGIKVTVAPGGSLFIITNNILSNNGAYGLQFSNASATDGALSQPSIIIVGNQTYLNTSGAYKSNTGGYSYNTCPWASGDNNLNPTFTGGTDYSIGTNLKAKGYPLAGSLYVGKTSTTYSYIDPGAAQRQEAGVVATTGFTFS